MISQFMALLFPSEGWQARELPCPGTSAGSQEDPPE